MKARVRWTISKPGRKRDAAGGQARFIVLTGVVGIGKVAGRPRSRISCFSRQHPGDLIPTWPIVAAGRFRVAIV
jgi:hypothetical protein